MSKENDETWREFGIGHNLAIRYILRNGKDKELDFVVQLERENPARPIILWDNSHDDNPHYHIFHLGEKQERVYLNTDDLNDFIDKVFEMLEKDLMEIIGKSGNEDLLKDKELSTVMTNATFIKNKIIERENLNFGVTHNFANIGLDAMIVSDSIKIDKNGKAVLEQ